ncbi:hypothetical protein D3C73_1602390 [compost metagenome]
MTDSRSRKKKYPRIAAIPPDKVLITVTTETEPFRTPKENAEKPPKLKRLAPHSEP